MPYILAKYSVETMSIYTHTEENTKCSKNLLNGLQANHLA